MYCSDCGAQATGNFCAHCGTTLCPVEEELILLADWREEIRYELLLRFPEVRKHVTRHVKQAQKQMSGERFLELCDRAFEPLVGVSLHTVASIVVPIYARMGIRTGKSRSEYIPIPTGQALVAALCSLALYGRSVEHVHQGEDGCVIEAVLPSDIWSWEGQLIISIERSGRGTQVDAATKIAGQLFDWGKSKQCLNQLFEDVETLLG